KSKFECLRMLAFPAYADNIQYSRGGADQYCILSENSQEILSIPGCEVKEITGTRAVEVSGVPSCLTRISQLASVLDNALIKRKD
ncbi:hypothetical protein MJM99_33405, partial [Salmonella enterica subsp. enterica serovar Kentucky]|nr:hypothetical protein [Salmonella enterica subsp. enterica serovar Kentucky]